MVESRFKDLDFSLFRLLFQPPEFLVEAVERQKWLLNVCIVGGNTFEEVKDVCRFYNTQELEALSQDLAYGMFSQSMLAVHYRLGIKDYWRFPRYA